MPEPDPTDRPVTHETPGAYVGTRTAIDRVSALVERFTDASDLMVRKADLRELLARATAAPDPIGYLVGTYDVDGQPVLAWDDQIHTTREDADEELEMARDQNRRVQYPIDWRLFALTEISTTKESTDA